MSAIAGAGAAAMHQGGKSYITETVQSLPAMTSDTAPAGHVASATDVYQTFYAYFAFDKSTSTFWHSFSSHTPPLFLARQTPTPIRLGAYRIRSRADFNTQAPINFTFEGSNDGVTWDVLDTQGALSWSLGELKEFSINVAVRNLYNRHRINMGALNGFVAVAEFELLQDL